MNSNEDLCIPIPEQKVCSRCGGTRTILVDCEFSNRAERRKARHNKYPMQKYVPCPECCK
jgi:hypothetical protein